MLKNFKIMSFTYCVFVCFCFTSQSVKAFSIKRLILKNKIKKMSYKYEKSIINLGLALEDILLLKEKGGLDFELFASANNFLFYYRQYEQHEMDLEKFLYMMKSDPLKYANILKLDAAQVGQRKIHAFCDPFNLKKTELDYLNFLSKKFKGHTDFKSLIIGINRQFALRQRNEHEDTLLNFATSQIARHQPQTNEIMVYPVEESDLSKIEPSAPPYEALKDNTYEYSYSSSDNRNHKDPPSYQEALSYEQSNIPIAYPVPSAPPMFN